MIPSFRAVIAVTMLKHCPTSPSMSRATRASQPAGPRQYNWKDKERRRTRFGTRRRINGDLTRLLRRIARNWQATFVSPLTHLRFGLLGPLWIQSAIASEIENTVPVGHHYQLNGDQEDAGFKQEAVAEALDEKSNGE